MAIQYIFAVTLIAIMTIGTISRWSSPTNALGVFAEARLFEKAALAVAKDDCLANTISPFESREYSMANGRFILSLIADGYLAADDFGFDGSANVNASPNTNIIWQYAGWQNGGAIIRANAPNARKFQQLKLMYPVHIEIDDRNLQILTTGGRSSRFDSNTDFVRQEYFPAENTQVQINLGLQSGNTEETFIDSLNLEQLACVQ
ncbi:MAG: hypothetical protein AAF197_00335 [Pseudomonadota bacterium]